MILPIHAAIRLHLQAALAATFNLAPADQPPIVIETPPTRAMGDLAVPVAFELARRLRKAPRAIAQELAAALGPIEGIARVQAAPNGYLNFSLERAAFLVARLSGAAPAKSARTNLPEEANERMRVSPRERSGAGAPASERVGGFAGAKPPDKVIIEHTAINPNKAAHIGHLRNATLGDTLVRLLRFQGALVEVQNYIDDTGVQVADVVVGFTELEGRDLEAVRALEADPAVRFDDYCWDLYARVTAWYEGDKARLEIRARALHAVEEGGNALADLGAFIADRIVRCHLRTMARLNVGYDLLTWEGDILRLHFWTTAFEQLKARGAVFLQTEGRLKGCWVMTIEDSEPDAAAVSDAPASEHRERARANAGVPAARTPRGGVAPAGPGAPASERVGGAAPLDDARGALSSAERAGAEPPGEEREKVIVRSNGTVTYVGKDIANQFWKFGLLGRDFHYRVFEREGDRILWATTSVPQQGVTPPAFGRAAAVYNVIDSRQSYLQQLLKQALAAMGFTREAERSTHFSYEMVALSHATARALGYEAAGSGDTPFVEVSGRKGLGVKADDLLDRLVETAAREVASRNPELPDPEVRRIAEQIGTAAVRYFLIKFSRGKVIAFDIDEALSFEGETGPYLQYAVVRANNIFAKLRERGLDEAGVLKLIEDAGRGPIEEGDEAQELWGLALEAGRLDEVVEASVRSLEPGLLAKYAFGLAQAFNAFYHRQQILREERQDARAWRAAAVAYVRRQLTLALDLMGCAVPAKM